MRTNVLVKQKQAKESKAAIGQSRVGPETKGLAAMAPRIRIGLISGRGIVGKVPLPSLANSKVRGRINCLFPMKGGSAQ